MELRSEGSVQQVASTALRGAFLIKGPRDRAQRHFGTLANAGANPFSDREERATGVPRLSPYQRARPLRCSSQNVVGILALS
ncbi:unnamed protein product [Lampetra fluviatilis]